MSSWIWKDDLHSEDQASLGTRPAALRDLGLRFDDGVLVVHPATGNALGIALSREDDGFFTDNLVATGFPGLLVSSRLRAVLEECGVDNIQYFPVNLSKSDGSAPPQQYFIANVVGRIACIDFEHSDITIDSGPPMLVDAIDRLVLHEGRIQDLNIFRLDELAVAVVVNSRVKDAIERSGVSGVSFYPIEEFIF